MKWYERLQVSDMRLNKRNFCVVRVLVQIFIREKYLVGVGMLIKNGWMLKLNIYDIKDKDQEI